MAANFQVGPTRTYTNLQAVARLLAPGDVVEVDGDATYTGGVTFDNDGTAAEKITIRGIRVNGQRPVLSGVNGLTGGAVVRIRAAISSAAPRALHEQRRRVAPRQRRD